MERAGRTPNATEIDDMWEGERRTHEEYRTLLSECREALKMVSQAHMLASASTPANLRRVIAMMVRPLLARLDAQDTR